MNSQSIKIFLDRYAMRAPNGKLLESSFHQLADRLGYKFARSEEERIEYSDALRNFDFVPGGRILSGTSADSTLFNCFVLPIKDNTCKYGADSRKAIMSTMTDMIEICARGGGVGINWSVLRPEGEYIHGVNGKSSGSTSWMQGADALADQIRQGGTRTAALMWMLDVWHPDMWNFVTRTERFKRANFSVGVSDAFMERVRSGGCWDLIFPDITQDDYDSEWDGDIEHWIDKNYDVKQYQSMPARDLFQGICESAGRLGSPGLIFLDTCNRMSNTWYLERLQGTNPCVTGNTLVQTVEGQIPIKGLVGQEIDVYCVDEEYKLTISRAKNIRMTQKNATLIKVVTTKGTVICTPDHEIYTRNRGYVPAFDLKIEDKVVALNKSPQNEHYAKAYLTGKSASVIGEHRFIAQHYWGNLADMDVHHIDGNKLNNALSNLEVMKHSDHSIISNLGHPDWCVRNEKTGRFIPMLGNAKRKIVSNSLGIHPVGTNMRLIEVIPLNYTEDVYDLEVEEHHNFFANHVLVHNCGEQPLPPYGSCNLGSINLVKMWDEELGGGINPEKLDATVRTAVKFLDRVTDVSKDVLEVIGDQQRSTRRVGLGTMGLADVLIMSDIRYGSEECLEFIDKLYSKIRDSAYAASIDLAEEYGPAPALDIDKFLQSGFIQTLPAYLRKNISRAGIRNLTLLSQAPTGTTSLLAGVSSGIEPIFAREYIRTDATGTHTMTHPLFEGYQGDHLVTAHELNFREHIAVQAQVQKYIDSAVSKTINLPACATNDQIGEAYMLAWRSGCKGITVYRDGSLEGVCEICEAN